MPVVSSAHARTDMLVMVSAVRMLMSALATHVVITPLVTTLTVASNVSAMLVSSRRTVPVLTSTSVPTTRRTTATEMPSVPIFQVASHVPAKPISRVMV
jgi:hypothetical protein